MWIFRIRKSEFEFQMPPWFSHATSAFPCNLEVNSTCLLDRNYPYWPVGKWVNKLENNCSHSLFSIWQQSWKQKTISTQVGASNSGKVTLARGFFWCYNSTTIKKFNFSFFQILFHLRPFLLSTPSISHSRTCSR